MNKITCISADIFKWSLGDCSNNGISSRFTEVLVPVDGGYIEVDLDNPPENLVKVIRRNIFGREYVHVTPWTLAESGMATMHGGTFVHSSDSRFNETIDNGHYPVALHDRVER